MERLTHKRHDSDAYTIGCSRSCRGGECGDCEEFGKIIERLAAYEDTGLTPEECAEYKKFEDEIIASGKTFGRLIELLNADREGRAAVLPRKVGDPVYFATRFGAQPHIVKRVIEPYFYTVGVKNGIDTGKFSLRDFGKTVFSTREEAEKALRKAENG